MREAQSFSLMGAWARVCQACMASSRQLVTCTPLNEQLWYGPAMASSCTLTLSREPSAKACTPFSLQLYVRQRHYT